MQGVFQHVYETVQFAKLKLLARALERAQLYEGGGLVVSYLLRDDFAEVGAEEPYSEGIIDHLRSVEGSEMVALIRSRRATTARRGASRCARATTRWMSPRSPARRAAAATARRQASRPKRRSTRSSTSCAASTCRRRMPPRALKPVGVALVDKPAGPSSFALVAALRRRTRARTGHAGTLDPFATGLLLLLSGAATGLHRASSGSTSATSPTSTSGRRPRRVIRRARSSRTRAAAPASWTTRSPRCAARSSCRSRRVGGEDRRRARLQARPSRRHRRDAAPPLDRPRARARRAG